MQNHRRRVSIASGDDSKTIPLKEESKWRNDLKREKKSFRRHQGNYRERPYAAKLETTTTKKRAENLGGKWTLASRTAVAPLAAADSTRITTAGSTKSTASSGSTPTKGTASSGSSRGRRALANKESNTKFNLGVVVVSAKSKNIKGAQENLNNNAALPTRTTTMVMRGINSLEAAAIRERLGNIDRADGEEAKAKTHYEMALRMIRLCELFGKGKTTQNGPSELNASEMKKRIVQSIRELEGRIRSGMSCSCQPSQTDSSQPPSKSEESKNTKEEEEEEEEVGSTVTHPQQGQSKRQLDPDDENGAASSSSGGSAGKERSGQRPEEEDNVLDDELVNAAIEVWDDVGSEILGFVTDALDAICRTCETGGAVGVGGIGLADVLRCEQQRKRRKVLHPLQENAAIEVGYIDPKLGEGGFEMVF